LAEVLSQSEINALLQNVSEDKPEVAAESQETESTYYLYDFKHPNRVSKDQLRNLRTIHEGFSRMLATYLTTLLRTMVDVHLLSIDQVTFLEFTMAMSNPGCIWVFKPREYEGKGIVEVSPDLILLTIERLFGGEGKQSGDARPLSIIEQNVASRIIAKIMKIYDEAWEKAVPLTTDVVTFEMNPQFAQIAPASETAVVMFLEISVRNTTFPLNVCFPYYVLDPIILQLNAESWVTTASKESKGVSQGKIKYNVENSQVDFKAQLGETSITVKELLALEKGDIIMLDKKVNDSIKMFVGDRPRFLGSAGITGKKMAVQIHEQIKAEFFETRRPRRKNNARSVA